MVERRGVNKAAGFLLQGEHRTAQVLQPWVGPSSLARPERATEIDRLNPKPIPAALSGRIRDGDATQG